MPKITVESEALDSLKEMAQRLQEERDALLNAGFVCVAVLGDLPSTNRGGTATRSAWDAMSKAISKCTAKQAVMK